MNIIKITTRSLAIAALLLTAQAFKGDKDALHKKKYTVQMVEMRDGKPKNKGTEDEIEFKDGKVFSIFAFDKMEFKWIKYDIKKDSTYTEDEEERKYYEVEASTTNDKDETLYMNFVINNYEMTGTMKLTKNDKPKKAFEFTGKEQVKKGKEKK